MSSAYMCGCVIKRPGTPEENHYCSRHLPPEGVEALQGKCFRYEEALRAVLSELGPCNDEEKARGYCAGHPMLVKLPCPIGEARKLVGM